MFPIRDLTARFDALTARYGKGKIKLTETGWPSEGVAYGERICSIANEQSYFNQYVEWAKSLSGEDCPFYFQFQDTPYKDGFEAHFGLSENGISWKFDILPTPAPTTLAPTSAPPTTAPLTTTSPDTTFVNTSNSTTFLPVAYNVAPSNDAMPYAEPSAASSREGLTTMGPRDSYEDEFNGILPRSSSLASSTPDMTIGLSCLGIAAVIAVLALVLRQLRKSQQIKPNKERNEDSNVPRPSLFVVDDDGEDHRRPESLSKYQPRDSIAIL
jgi:hypothetical protein